MMDLYGSALVRERLGSDEGGDLGRYLRWEYGEGTGRGFLNVHEFRRRTPRSRRRPRIAALAARLFDAIRGSSPAPRDGVYREMSLLAERKKGRIRTVELVCLLEDLRQSEPTEETRLSLR